MSKVTFYDSIRFCSDKIISKLINFDFHSGIVCKEVPVSLSDCLVYLCWCCSRACSIGSLSLLLQAYLLDTFTVIRQILAYNFKCGYCNTPPFAVMVSHVTGSYIELCPPVISGIFPKFSVLWPVSEARVCRLYFYDSSTFALCCNDVRP